VLCAPSAVALRPLLVVHRLVVMLLLSEPPRQPSHPSTSASCTRQEGREVLVGCPHSWGAGKEEAGGCRRP
jgi:hypothetical protein